MTLPTRVAEASAQRTAEGCTVVTKHYQSPQWGLVEDITLYCTAQIPLSLAQETRKSNRHRDHSKNWEH